MENWTEMEIKTPPKIHAYAYHICRAWYNQIKFLELHYTMTQFLIIPVIYHWITTHDARA